MEEEIDNQEPAQPKAKERTWHWYSNPQTVVNMELSALALAETVLATSVYIIFAYLGYTIHLIIASCVAPFFLLRNKQSTLLSFKVYVAAFDRITTFLRPIILIDPEKNSTAFIYPVRTLLYTFYIIGIVIAASCAKIIATFISFVKCPYVCISSIPQNWMRYFGCLDFKHPIEVLPGYFEIANKQMNVKKGHGIFVPMKTVSQVYRAIPKGSNQWNVALLLAPITFMILVIPAIVYRLSIKGCSLIYLPLIWIAHTTATGTFSVRLVNISDLAFHWLKRISAVIVLLFVGSKLFAINWWSSANDTWLEFFSTPFITLYIAPLELPRWQLASGVNALLVWILYLIANYYVVQYKRDENYKISKLTEYTVRSIWLVSAILSLYTISILIYNAFSLEWGFVKIGEKWFPW